MRSESSPIGQESTRTFTETARRAQIVAAAIDTIAELGYGQASLARIAETAGTGEVRAGFDPHVMAMVIRAAINAVPAQLARDRTLDVAHHAREIADMFHIATRPGSHPVP